jgi:hypothetical protein
MAYFCRENFEASNNAIIYSNPVITKLLKYDLEVYINAYRFLNQRFKGDLHPSANTPLNWGEYFSSLGATYL